MRTLLRLGEDVVVVRDAGKGDLTVESTGDLNVAAVRLLHDTLGTWLDSVDPVLEFEIAVEVTGEPSSKPDAPRNFILRTLCPHCLALDTVTHRDAAIRWNGLRDPEILELDEFTRTALGDHVPSTTVTAHVIEAQKNFEDDGYFCMACRIELVQPDYFDIHWS